MAEDGSASDAISNQGSEEKVFTWGNCVEEKLASTDETKSNEIPKSDTKPKQDVISTEGPLPETKPTIAPKPKAKFKNPPPFLPKTGTESKDHGEENKGSSAVPDASDHPSNKEEVIIPALEKKPVALGPDPPPESVNIDAATQLPTRPPPTFTTVTKTGKGEIAATPASSEKGKRVIFIPDPMAVLQNTLGIPPANQAELYERQLCAQQLGGLRPTMYNWLVFGQAPGAVIPQTVPSTTVESIAGDASGKYPLGFCTVLIPPTFPPL